MSPGKKTEIMSVFAGEEVGDPNYLLRFSLIVVFGLFAFGSLILWRGEVLFAADYQAMPVTHQELRIKKHNQSVQEKMRNGLMEKYEEE